jgi:tellurite methyltransferase
VPRGKTKLAKADRERWESKYAAGNPNAAFSPDPLLVQHAQLFDGHGWAFDVACGVGQNAIWLARRGYEVLAVDGSFTGLRYGREAAAATDAHVHFVAADLDRFIVPEGTFALIIVFRYLDRSLVPRLKQAVVPGGLIVYETFNINRLRSSPQMTRSYLLEPGELARLFGDFETVETNDTADVREELSYWIGRRPK